MQIFSRYQTVKNNDVENVRSPWQSSNNYSLSSTHSSKNAFMMQNPRPQTSPQRLGSWVAGCRQTLSVRTEQTARTFAWPWPLRDWLVHSRGGVGTYLILGNLIFIMKLWWRIFWTLCLCLLSYRLPSDAGGGVVIAQSFDIFQSGDQGIDSFKTSLDEVR